VLLLKPNHVQYSNQLFAHLDARSVLPCGKLS
jgi:hypothetical protein